MARAPQDKKWEINGDPFYVDDEEALAQALSECITILTRVSGGITIAPYRVEIAPDIWHTQGYFFKWSSFVPAVRYQEAEGEPEQSLEAVAEPEPAEVA